VGTKTHFYIIEDFNLLPLEDKEYAINVIKKQLIKDDKKEKNKISHKKVKIYDK